jgi:WD40 repeat protein
MHFQVRFLRLACFGVGVLAFLLSAEMAVPACKAQEPMAMLDGRTAWLWSVAFTPDGKTLATGSWHDEVTLWDLDTGKEKATLKEAFGYVIAFTPDSKTLATGTAERGVVKLWDVCSGKLVTELKGDNGPVHAVAFSSNGKTLATSCYDGTVKLWDLTTNKERATLGKAKRVVHSLAFSPDDKIVASGDGKLVNLWNAAQGDALATLKGHDGDVNSLAFTADGKILASGSSDGAVRLWDVAKRKHLATLGGSDGVTSVAVSPDGKALAAACESTLKIWDLSTYKVWLTLEVGYYRIPGDNRVLAVAIAPDGKSLASGNVDCVRLWNLQKLLEKMR